MPLGKSFAPGADDLSMQQGNGGGVGRSRLSPQQAVKILSLRVPESLPSNAPVNRALLTSPGGSAPGAGGLQSLIQQLLQAFKPSAGSPAMAGGQAPQSSPVGAPPPSPVGIPPASGGQPAPFMPTAGAPTPYQPFPNPPAYAPQPNYTPHITWGDELNMGPAPPLNLGQNPDEIEEWSRMFNLGPSGAFDWSRLPVR